MLSKQFPALANLDGPILITGHTGFKGTWATLLLERLGFQVCGIALEPKQDSLYSMLEREGDIDEAFFDITNEVELQKTLNEMRPSVVLHMAAQALVLPSYDDPVGTFNTNVMGTANLLNTLTKATYCKAIGVVTTDKVYLNDNSGKDFRENDPLSGKDPYSASKVGTEAVTSAWQNISKIVNGPEIISLRAGNVIGGGDLAQDRLIPDIIRSIQNDLPLFIRNAESTRPWQHVLDPIIGYLKALNLTLSSDHGYSAFNFGPKPPNLTVSQVAAEFKIVWPDEIEITRENDLITKEAINLALNSDLAMKVLAWKPVWNQPEAVRASATWWNRVLNQSQSPLDACLSDIDFALANL